MSKTKQQDAEKAAVWFAREYLGCSEHRRAVRTQWQSVDMFGTDVVANHADGTRYWIQVTTGAYSAIAARRRKLESHLWTTTDRVTLLQLTSTKNPANRRLTDWWFRVEEYHAGAWTTWPKAVSVPKGWFKQWK